MAKSLKGFVKQRMPWLTSPYSYLIWNLYLRPKMRYQRMGVFTEIFKKNAWLGDESVSGTGSSLRATEVIRSELPQIIRRYGVETMLDIPCGDFHWMKEANLPLREYIGADVVKEIVDLNAGKYTKPGRSFVVLDLTEDNLPSVDLIFCRDCLFHLSFKDVNRALQNVRNSGSEYFLATTNPNFVSNRDIVTGEWRKLNLQIAPFALPKPLLIINEDPYDSTHEEDKHMALWRVRDI
jgi:hypothetical protein